MNGLINDRRKLNQKQKMTQGAYYSQKSFKQGNWRYPLGDRPNVYYHERGRIFPQRES